MTVNTYNGQQRTKRTMDDNILHRQLRI